MFATAISRKPAATCCGEGVELARAADPDPGEGEGEGPPAASPICRASAANCSCTIPASRGWSPRSPNTRGKCAGWIRPRSEEHTSELQSRRDLVCRLLLEKKKNQKNNPIGTKNNKKINIDK